MPFVETFCFGEILDSRSRFAQSPESARCGAQQLFGSVTKVDRAII